MTSNFEQAQTAIIEPSKVIKKIDNFPETGLACFSKKLFETWVEIYDGEEIAHFNTEEGPLPIYRVNFDGKHIAVFLIRVGAPAAAIQLEEIIAMGLKSLLVMGSCGVLDKTIELGDLIIPTSGYRDEGTSKHYGVTTSEISGDQEQIEKLSNILKDHKIQFRKGKTWTTDAVYRETKEKMLARKAEGCITVDMEFTALQAVASFRGISFCQIFYGQDNLDALNWENRGSVVKQSQQDYSFVSVGPLCAKEL